MIYRTCHLRIESVLLVVLLLSPMTLAWGQDEEPTIEFFYPVVTRRPVIERELELSVKHSKSPKGREAEVAAAFEWPILPRWQLEVEFPFVIRDPAGGPTVGGLSDIAIENKVLLYKSVEYRLLVATGVEVTVPSGSERRELGGELGVEPFVTAGIALGPFDLLGEVAYEWTFQPERAEQLATGLALGYPAWRRFTPFLELRTVTPTRGADHRTQAYLVPGFNVRPRPGVTVRLGVQLPVADVKAFDYEVRGAVVWEF